MLGVSYCCIHVCQPLHVLPYIVDKYYGHNVHMTGFQSCPYDGDYRCPSDGACIRAYEVCDDRCTCGDCSDEDNCSEFVRNKIKCWELRMNHRNVCIEKITLYRILISWYVI